MYSWRRCIAFIFSAVCVLFVYLPDAEMLLYECSESLYRLQYRLSACIGHFSIRLIPADRLHFHNTSVSAAASFSKTIFDDGALGLVWCDDVIVILDAGGIDVRITFVLRFSRSLCF